MSAAIRSYEARVRALEAEGLTTSDAQAVIDAEELTLAEKAADAGESIAEYVCGTTRGHDFPQVEEHERCLCLWCGKDGDA